MASDVEENNLADLRSAVLASLKTTTNTKSDEEEDDLEALRQAALMSRKSAVKNSEDTCPPATSHIPQGRNQFPRWRNFRSGHRGGGQHKFPFRPLPRSNLIVINTVPLENVSSNTESKPVSKLLLPQERSVYTESSPKLDSRSKSSGRFSRFDTSSESEESDLESVEFSSDARDGTAFSSEGHHRLGASEDSTTQDMDCQEEASDSDGFSSQDVDTSVRRRDCDNKISESELRISMQQHDLEKQQCVKGSKVTFHQSDKVGSSNEVEQYSDAHKVINRVQNVDAKIKDADYQSNSDIGKDVVEGYNHDCEHFSNSLTETPVENIGAIRKESKISTLIPKDDISPSTIRDNEIPTDIDNPSIITSTHTFPGQMQHGKGKNCNLQCSDKKNGVHGFQHKNIGASNASLQYERPDKPLSTWDLRMELKRRKEERGKKEINHTALVVSSRKHKTNSENYTRSRSASTASSTSSSHSESSKKSWSDNSSDTSSISPSRSSSRSRSSSPLVKSVLSVVKPVSQKSDSTRGRLKKSPEEHVGKLTVWNFEKPDRIRVSEHISYNSRFDVENAGRNGTAKKRRKVSPLSLTEERATKKHPEREVYLGNSMLLSGTSFDKSKKLPVHMRLGLPHKHNYEASQKDKQNTSPKSEKKDSRHKKKKGASFSQTVREVSFSSSRGSSDIYIVSTKPQKTDDEASTVKSQDNQKRPYREKSHDRSKKQKKKRL